MAAYRSFHNDRAAAVAVALIQIIATAPHEQWKQQFGNYLRCEFADERRQIIADRGLADA